jgi:WD40 repeat protein
MPKVLCFVVACIVGVLTASMPVLAQTTPPEPQLCIDPGMHTGSIRRVAVNRSCTLLATTSRDKTVRLWGCLTES